MAQAQVQAKLNYKPKSSIEVFYSGGAVALSKNGQLACACQDDIKDTEAITSLAFSPDSKHLFSASRSLQQKWWDAQDGTCLRTWKGHRAPVAHMAVDASGGLLATASSDKSAKVWDIQGGFCTHSFTGHSGVVLQVLFIPKQLMLVTSGDDSDVRVWDLVNKSCVAVLKGHFSAVTSLSLASDGWTLLSGGRDKVAHLWDLRHHTKLVTVPVYEALEGAVILPSDKGFPGTSNQKAIAGKKAVFFATAGEKGVVKVWSAATAECVYEHKGQSGMQAGNYVELALLPDGAGLMAASADCNLHFFTPQDKHLQLTKQLIGNNDEVTDIRFLGAPKSPTHIAVSSNSEVIRIFSLTDMSCTASLEGHSETVLTLDAMYLASPAGEQQAQSLLVSGAKDNQIRLWDCDSSRCLGMGEGHVAAVSAVAFSRRSTKFMVSGGADNLLKVWDLAAALAVSGTPADGAKPGKLKATAATAAHDKDINAVAVAPNDSLICTASQDRTAKVWRMPDLVLVTTLRGHKRGVWAAQFSPVDQAVATASGDKTLRLWALADGSCLKTFEGHTASVLRLNFLSAGTQLMSSGADGLLKLWNVRSTECLNTFDAHEDKVWALAVGSGEERLLASGGGDARVQVWQDCTVADKQEAAQEQEASLLKQQRLSNALQDKDYAAAAQLAFELKQPGRLLAVVQKAYEAGPAKAHHILAALVKGLDQEQLKLSLEYIRDWNSNSRHCSAAQAMLQAILVQHQPEVLLSLPGMQDLLEALASYTQRHFVRIDRLVRSSFLLDYTLSSMNVIMPEADAQHISRHAPDTNLQQTTVAQSDTIRADGDIQTVLAEQSIQAQLQQVQGKDTLQGELQQELPEAKLDGSQNQSEDSQKTKVSSKRRKSGSKPTEANAASTVKAKRKKA